MGSQALRQDAFGPLSHERAAEYHAVKRLASRYRLSKPVAREKMYEHLALILADHAVLQGYWPRDGKQLILVPVEIDYFVIFDPSIRRIVTYLPDNLVVRRSRGRLKGKIVWEKPDVRAPRADDQ